MRRDAGRARAGRAASASADELGFFGLLVGEGRDVRGVRRRRPSAPVLDYDARRGTDLDGAPWRRTSTPAAPRPGRPRRCACTSTRSPSGWTGSAGCSARTGHARSGRWRSSSRCGCTGSPAPSATEPPPTLGGCLPSVDLPGAARGRVDGARRGARGAGRPLDRAAPRAPPARARRTRCWTSCSPTTPRRPAGCAAGTRARASPLGRARRRTPRWRWYATDARRHRAARRRRPSWPTAATPSGSSAGCWRRRPARPAFSGCFGLHEWAMVYRDDAARGTRCPLRLGQAGTDAVVEAHPIRCTPLRRVPVLHAARRRPQPPAADPGDASPSWSSRAACTPAMDLYKWAYKLSPADPGRAGRRLLRAGRARSASWTCGPRPTTCARTATSRSRSRRPRARPQYVAAQRGFAERGAVLRQRLIDVCDRARLDVAWRRRAGCRPRDAERHPLVPSAGDLHAHRPLGAARRHRRTPATWAACPPPTAARTVPGRILRSDNLQTLSEDDVRRLVRRDRPARGDRPAHDGGDPARGPRAAARRPRGRRTGTSACCPSAATTPTSSPSRRTRSSPTCPRAGWSRCCPGRSPSTTRASRRPSAPTSATSATAATASSPRCARSPTAGPGASVVHCAAGKDRTGVVVRAGPGRRRRRRTTRSSPTTR